MFRKSEFYLSGNGENAIIALCIPGPDSCQFEPPPSLPKYRQHSPGTLQARLVLLLLHNRKGRSYMLLNLRRMVNVEKVPNGGLESHKGKRFDLSLLDINKVLGSSRIVNELLCKIEVFNQRTRETEDRFSFFSSDPSGLLNKDSFLTRSATSLIQAL